MFGIFLDGLQRLCQLRLALDLMAAKIIMYSSSPEWLGYELSPLDDQGSESHSYLARLNDDYSFLLVSQPTALRRTVNLAGSI